MKKRAHTRITEVIAFPVRSWEIVREAQRIDAIKEYVKVLKANSQILVVGVTTPLSAVLRWDIAPPRRRWGHALSEKRPACEAACSVLILTGAIRIQVRFTLKEAESMARRKDEYYVPGALAERLSFKGGGSALGRLPRRGLHRDSAGRTPRFGQKRRELSRG